MLFGHGLVGLLGRFEGFQLFGPMLIVLLLPLGPSRDGRRAVLMVARREGADVGPKASRVAGVVDRARGDVVVRVILLYALVMLGVCVMLMCPLRLDIGIVHHLGHSAPTGDAIQTRIMALLVVWSVHNARLVKQQMRGLIRKRRLSGRRRGGGESRESVSMHSDKRGCWTFAWVLVESRYRELESSFIPN